MDKEKLKQEFQVWKSCRQTIIINKREFVNYLR